MICESDLQPWYSFMKDLIFFVTYELVGDKKQGKGSGRGRPWEVRLVIVNFEHM